MSRVLIPFRCEQCGKVHQKAVYDGVDISREPQYRAKVMDASIFDFVCPSCGTVNGVIYPFLYHDPSRRFMVQLVDSGMKGDPFVDVFQGDDAEDTAMRQVSEDMKSRYRMRTVRTPNDLMEKIAVFEAGYDDRIVELMKAGFLSSNPDAEHLYYLPTDNGPQFLIEEKGDFVRSIPFDEELYHRLEHARQFDDHETEIDQNWVKRKCGS